MFRANIYPRLRSLVLVMAFSAHAEAQTWHEQQGLRSLQEIDRAHLNTILREQREKQERELRLRQEQREQEQKITEGPLRCFFRNQTAEVMCDVVSDQVRITGAQLNRGNCSDPVAVQEDEYKEAVAMHNEMKSWQSCTTEPGYFPKEVGPGVNRPPNLRPDAHLLQKCTQRHVDLKEPQKTDFRASYKFGDQFRIPTGQCRLLEFSIIVDGTRATWSIK